MFKHCPKCGFKLSADLNAPKCRSEQCSFIFWQNSKPCVSLIITNRRSQVLMTKRAFAPDKGKLDLPGGFLNYGETPYAGAKREALEELGVPIRIIAVLGFANDTYGPERWSTLNIGLLAEIISGTPKAADDAAAFTWINPATVPPKKLAFKNNVVFLKLLSKTLS